MTATALLPPTPQPLEDRVIETALTNMSPCSRRAYKGHIKRWRLWAAGAPLDRLSVKGFMHALELQGATPQVRNQALAALKKLAYEAGELGWIDPAVAAQIRSIQSKRIVGMRTGIWLTAQQAAALLQAPDGTTAAGKRDRCVLALLIGCGLRRSEAHGLNVDQIKIIDGRMVLTNINGKGGRIRNVAVPVWAAQIIEVWIQELRIDMEWKNWKRVNDQVIKAQVQQI